MVGSENDTEVYDLFMRGQDLIDHKDYAQATIPLAKATRLDPDKASIRESYGRALLGARRYDEAAAQFTEALRLSPTDPFLHRCLARALLRSGDRRAAARHVRLADALGG
jgi:predicted Zn-dependent protease